MQYFNYMYYVIVIADIRNRMALYMQV